MVLCTPNHKWHTFKAIVLPKYLTGELGYEPLVPRSDKYSGRLKRDEARRSAEYTFSICLTFGATGKSEPAGQCAILRNEEKAEVPVLPLVKPRKMEKLRNISAPLSSIRGKAVNVPQKLTSLGKALLPADAREPVRLASDWTKP